MLTLGRLPRLANLSYARRLSAAYSANPSGNAWTLPSSYSVYSTNNPSVLQRNFSMNSPRPEAMPAVSREKFEKSEQARLRGSDSALMLMGGSLLLGFFAKRARSDDAKTYTLNDYLELRHELLESFHDDLESKLQKASLLGCINTGDLDFIDLRLTELRDQGKKISRRQFELLLNMTALQGKASVLEVFVKHFGAGAVNSVAKARMLLNHPARAEIEALVTGYFNYYFKPEAGLFQPENLRAALQKKADDFVNSTVSQPILSGDSIDDAYLFLNYIKEEKAHMGWFDASIEDKYRNTLLIDGEEGRQEFETFIEDLKEKAASRRAPVVGSFIIGGTHFTSGDLKVEKVGADFKVTLLYFDSTGRLTPECIQNYAHGSYVRLLWKHFSSVDIFSSESKLQHMNYGCPLFSLIRTVEGIESDKDLALLPQYAETENIHLLFNYAVEKRTRTFGMREYDREQEKNWYQPIHNFLTPVFMQKTKSSFNHPEADMLDQHLRIEGELTGSQLEEELTMVGTNETFYAIFDRSSENVVGCLGLDQEKARCAGETGGFLKERSAEFQTAQYNGLTPEQEYSQYIIIGKDKNTGEPKKINTIVQKKSGEYGIEIAQWLVRKSPEEIKQMKAACAFHPKFAGKAGAGMHG